MTVYDEHLLVRVHLGGEFAWQEEGRAADVIRKVLDRLEGVPPYEGQTAIQVRGDHSGMRAAVWHILDAVYRVPGMLRPPAPTSEV